jgi:TolA-binding protein
MPNLRPTSSACIIGLTTGLLGCASGTDDLAQRLDASDADLRDHVIALERSLDAAYDREKALAERLRRMEEGLAILQARVAASEERIDSLGRPPAGTRSPDAFDVTSAYDAAYGQHQDHNFEAALAAFADIVERAPTHSLADNAQYWIGESYYGLGRYRQALAAFTRVHAFDPTEKEDDAQLMIARSYLALGEKDQAVTAFRRLMSEYADSEYVTAARKELRYLEGE